MPVCFDAALRLCRDRDFQVLREERIAAERATLCARGRGYEFTLDFDQAPPGKTHLTVRVRGCGTRENLDEAMSLLNRLSDLLLEPRE
jgi:hypothetical protein